MSMKKRGLGKGLNELLSATLGNSMKAPQPVEPTPQAMMSAPTEGTSLVPDQELRYIPVEKCVPGVYQPRQQIAHEGLEQLAESIRVQGILQPIVVRPQGDHFEIVAGERRWRAAQLAGLTNVPTIVRSLPDKVAMALALIENIQRENLNPVEEAVALQRLADELQLTHLQVAESVGKSRASVTNLLRLLSLREDVLTLLKEGQLEMGHARALLGLKGSQQSEVAQSIVQRQLSVRETERLVAKLQEGEAMEEKAALPQSDDPNIRRLEEDLADKLGTPVAIRHGRRGGTVVIRYHNVDELEGILAHIK